MTRSVLGKLRLPLRQLADRYSILRGLIGRTWNSYERFRFVYHAWRNARDNQREPATVDPYQLIMVSPSSIDGHSPGDFDSIADAGRIVEGTWDRSKVSYFENGFRYPSFQEHFQEGIPWKKTKYYHTKVNQIHSDRETKFASVDALDRKCSELDRIYKEIQTEGYSMQVDLRTTRGTAGSIVGDGGRGLFPGSKHLIRNEVSLDIARDGELMLNEGRHRVCIVKLLGLESVPVRVVVRHRGWQNIRNRVARYVASQEFESLSEAFAAVEDNILTTEKIRIGVKHPDLRTVIESHYNW